jgi:hypothetical protein
MVALGNNVHIFARPQRRDAWRRLFDDVLGCGPVAFINHPGMAEPMMLVRFPGGGNLSIEFVDDADDSDRPRPATWLELRTEDPAATLQAVVHAGFAEVKHPGHPHYFLAPGGQVFTIAPIPH